ncbi:MAG: hypothetical protein IPP97_13070 [Candidatus Obscuribacter sp.]|nr:hypothetical protein [Candidatus Obscuribacter sp.]MBL0186662.1 hypothetical protein [Candidatus Obscuribacter sp.]MBP6349421.1 hypothetical protein [Candidatus Obscuribacter sp.]MBP6592171.1 hypothetical protein [Candidatus Obscuribacter sp.]MBP7578171.1 hypothetical protein [Candidatus Obscuribacter sp.]
MPLKHYSIDPITAKQSTSRSRAPERMTLTKLGLSLSSLTLLYATSAAVAQGREQLPYQAPPPDQYQPQPQSSPFRPATERRLLPAAPSPSEPKASAIQTTNTDTTLEPSDDPNEQTSDMDSSTQFTQIAQPEGTPALNVIVPAERPPVPTPPPVALPPIGRTEVKPPESWRIKANNLFKTAPDKNKICQSLYSGNLNDTINSIVQTFKQQGYKIGEVNARSGHILILLDNFNRTSNGNFDHQDRRDYTATATSKERVIIAVRTNVPNQDCEIRAFVDGRNKILTMDKVRQTLDQLRPVANPSTDEML